MTMVYLYKHGYPWYKHLLYKEQLVAVGLFWAFGLAVRTRAVSLFQRVRTGRPWNFLSGHVIGFIR